MNVTESKAGFLVIICPIGLKVRVPGAREKTAFAISSIILNIINFYMFHVTTVMNMLVIMAVKRTRRLQSNYNILLACLAGTDLLGPVSRSGFAAKLHRGADLCHKRFISVGILPIPSGGPSDVLILIFIIMSSLISSTIEMRLFERHAMSCWQ